MNKSVRRARILVGILCGVGMAALVPWIGPLPLALFALAPGPLLILDRLLPWVAIPVVTAAARCRSEDCGCSCPWGALP